MNPYVRKTLVMQLRADETSRFPVLGHLSYDAGDPFAVTVVFSHDGRVLARWRLDREMLADGLRRSVGVGDVRFAPRSTGAWDELCMEFFGDPRRDGDRHHAIVYAWAPGVESFLRATYDVVPPGREQVSVDDFLSELLANG